MAQPIWNTPAGSLGTFPSLVTIVPVQLSASAVLPAITVTYAIISGQLPIGLTMTQDGLIYGVPSAVPENTNYSFVVRATDNYGNIRDRTFTLSITGAESPSFITPAGMLFTQDDSVWVEYPILYKNTVSNNPVTIRVLQGQLPPGLEINDFGLIRGYPSPPISNINLPLVNTYIVAISSNVITAISTIGFSEGRPIIFTGDSFGNIISGTTYYIKQILEDGTRFTVSNTPGGAETNFTDAVGYMNATLPNVVQGQPTVQTYSFTLQLDSPIGSDTETYSITIANQQAPTSIGGSAKPKNTRVPTILNTRPATYNIRTNDIDYSYYALPPNGEGTTYPPDVNAFIGKFNSDDKFTFKILGKDFDNNQLEYVYADLPLGLVGDPVTGWITGNPIIGNKSISEYTFSVTAQKVANPSIQTPAVNFSFIIQNDMRGDVTWLTPADLGTISNGVVSTLKVQAESDVPLKYRLATGSTLPPNLNLLSNGEISGVVAYQPTDTLLPPNSTADFTFAIEAYSEFFPVVASTRTFNVTVDLRFGQPTDTLYIKCTPSVSDRNLLASLLDNTDIIPNDYLYRENDPYFGKANSVIYEHAFGIYASDFDDYVAAVTRNHYWRQLTLGEIKTAVARNEAGEIIYEVVYSEVIDNLTNPAGQSVSKEIFWPRFIPLSLGPWYTSETDIFTSYVEAPDGQQFYTSLSPGFARLLYPNSLPNMREQVGQVLGQEYNSNLLPSWMTSQQRDGSTTGFVPAWVIAYCKPGTNLSVVASATNGITNKITVTSTNGFAIGRPVTFTGNTFGNIRTNTVYYVREIVSATEFTISSERTLEQEYSLDTAVGTMTTVLPGISYAEIIKDNIENNWKDVVGNPCRLNQINFKIDRFTVDKSSTFNYDNNLSPPAWTGLPSGNPAPDPLDSKNFYVLFPRQTILPNNSQY